MKLIRPNTPDLERGSTRPVRDRDELQLLLRAKLMEEAAECAASTSQEEFIKEAADLLEVVSCLCSLLRVNQHIVETAMADKINRKGRLIDGIVLTHDPLSNKTTATV